MYQAVEANKQFCSQGVLCVKIEISGIGEDCHGTPCASSASSGISPRKVFRSVVFGDVPHPPLLMLSHVQYVCEFAWFFFFLFCPVIFFPRR